MEDTIKFNKTKLVVKTPFSTSSIETNQIFPIFQECYKALKINCSPEEFKKIKEEIDFSFDEKWRSKCIENFKKKEN